MKWCAVTFYTNPLYKRAADALGRSCAAAGIELRATKQPHLAEHGDNMIYKPRIVRDAFDDGYDGVLYLDADALVRDGAVVRAGMNLLDGCDAAWHWFKCFKSRVSERLYRGLTHWPGGGTLYFANTPKAFALLNDWERRIAESDKKQSDQECLYDAYLDTPGVKLCSLPLSWLAMIHDPNVDRENIVIEHMQVRHGKGYLDRA